MPVDPTSDNRYGESNGTEFSYLSVPAQELIRELLEEDYITRIIVYDGEEDWIGITSWSGPPAGKVVNKVTDAGLKASALSGTNRITIEAKEINDN